MSKAVNVFFVLIISMVAFSKFGGDVKNRINFARTGIEVTAYPHTFYDPAHVRGSDVSVQTKGSQGPLGSDFAQVYFSAKALRSGQSAYAP